MLIEAYLEEENKYKSNSNFYEAQTILNGLLIRIRDKVCSRFANTNISNPIPNPDPNPYPYPNPYYPYPYPYYSHYPYYSYTITYTLDHQTIGNPEKKQAQVEYYVPIRTDGGK